MRALSVLIVVGLVPACEHDQAAGTTEPDAVLPCAGSADGGQQGTGKWLRLATIDWQIESGVEDFLRLEFKAPAEHWVAGFRPVTPPGTHHVILFGSGSLLNELFVSLVDTGAYVLPPDVRMHINNDDAMAIQAHVMNSTPHTLKGTSGVEILDEGPPPEGTHKANLLNINLPAFTLPPGNDPITLRATCTLPSDMTLVALEPHMHKLGTEYRATLKRGDATTPLYAANLHGEGASYHDLGGIVAQRGDQILIDCTWVNTTGATVKYGGKVEDEMCAAMILRYPVGDSDFCEQ